MSLLALQTRIRTRLESAEFFSDSANAGARAISILTEDRHDIDDEIDRAIAEIGLLVLVMMPEFAGFESEKHGALHGKSTCRIRVAESVLVNRDATSGSASQQPAATVAEAVAARLHAHKPGPPFFALEVSDVKFLPSESHQIYEITVHAGYRMIAVEDRAYPVTMIWGDGVPMSW